MVVVIVAVLGSDPWRQRPRLYAAGVLTVWFLCRLPWWGIAWLNHPDWPRLPGRLLQNADLAGGLLALGLLWWVQRRYGGATAATAPGPSGSSYPPVDGVIAPTTAR